MKTFLFALFVAFILGINCSSFSGKVSVNEPEQDTVVRSVRDRSGWYCEFLSLRDKTLPYEVFRNSKCNGSASN